MSGQLRSKGKSTIVWVLMGMLVLGLGGFGITNFGGSTQSVGSVGDTEITTDEYLRALQTEMRGFSQQAGHNVTLAEAQAIGIPQAVQARLFAAAALEEEANRIGLSAGDELVARNIATAPAFQNGGRFDRAIYADLLRREGLTEAEFEHDMRMDEARVLLQRAVTTGLRAPAAVTDLTTAWLTQTRDIRYREITGADLPEPVVLPDQPALESWHQANAERFTAPESRSISYVWLTPEMLADEVQLDEQALRDLYQQRIDDYQQPERRMVERLVYPSQAEAEGAKARFDKGEVNFEQLAQERGLTLPEADLGEVTQAQLGAAGEAVFALEQPGVVGPFATDLGPALFQMNAILEPVNISFEEAREDLASEAGGARATRIIEDKMADIEDRLAGGATLEEVAQDTDMELGQIEWVPGTEAEPGSIAGYANFRTRAAALSERDFPELFALDDGGIFALRLDKTVPPALIPFDEARPEVEADWLAAETHRRLMALADEARLDAMAADHAEEGAPAAEPAGETAPEATDVPSAAVSELKTETGLTRDGFIEGTPQELVTRAFALSAAGETEVIDAGERVFLVTLDAIHQPRIEGENETVRGAVENRLSQSLQQDLFDYYARALMFSAGVRSNDSAISAVHARIQ